MPRSGVSASRELGPPWGVGLGCGLECGAAGGKLSGVLAEFKQVKQEASGGRRRWFEDEAMELIVWYRGDGAVDGFQLCYPGADRRERALTWRTVGGFSHALVDSGDTRPDKNLTPVLTPDGVVPWAKIETEFGARAAELEPELREFVAGHLRRRNE